ncbi:hypothetical protein H8356DRAFT_1425238 [Neocallimastix lanati (nom. inval.)]|nr:hypothetical protein H8356DRAFT_1425238 [Neocallimastix sp. JGI-2020a]
MEGNLKIDISETNRGKEQIIIDRKFKYNFSKLKKDNTKIYRCTEYKTLNKCKSFIILNDNKEVLNYDSSHNHPGNEINASKSLIKHKIKDEIKKSLIPSDIKSKRIFDKISQEIGYICPEYKTIKSQITRYKNKQLFPNVKTFDEVPNVSEYYKTIRGEYFMIFKNSNIIIFQSPFQAKLFMENKHIFADGTFLIAPTNSYQVFITRTYVTELNCFYTTSMSILKNKEQITYEILFNEIKKNIIKYNANINFSEKIFHCDFEKGISNAVENIFPNINIKYCFWQLKKDRPLRVEGKGLDYIRGTNYTSSMKRKNLEDRKTIESESDVLYCFKLDFYFKMEMKEIDLLQSLCLRLYLTDWNLFIMYRFSNDLELKPIIPRMINNKNPYIPILYKQILFSVIVIGKVSYYVLLLGSNKERTRCIQTQVNIGIYWIEGFSSGNSFTSLYYVAKELNILLLSRKCAILKNGKTLIVLSLFDLEIYHVVDVIIGIKKTEAYKKNGFEKTKDYLKLKLIILHASCEYKFDKRVAIAADMIEDNCSEWCPCYYRENNMNNIESSIDSERSNKEYDINNNNNGEYDSENRNINISNRILIIFDSENDSIITNNVVNRSFSETRIDINVLFNNQIISGDYSKTSFLVRSLYRNYA